jgi:hypothetical protein
MAFILEGVFKCPDKMELPALGFIQKPGVAHKKRILYI